MSLHVSGPAVAGKPGKVFESMDLCSFCRSHGANQLNDDKMSSGSDHDNSFAWSHAAFSKRRRYVKPCWLQLVKLLV